jgi:hypothetical protein
MSSAAPTLRPLPAARLFALALAPLACGGEPPEPAEVHLRVASLDSAPTCGPTLVASGLVFVGEREGQGSVLLVAEAARDADVSWWVELEALDDGRLLAALRAPGDGALAFDGRGEVEAAPALTRQLSPPALSGEVDLTLRDARVGDRRLLARVGPAGALPRTRAFPCEGSEPTAPPSAPPPRPAPPRAPGRTDVVVVADPGCGGSSARSSGCSGDDASGCSGDDASGCSGDDASGCSGDAASDAGGCSGDDASGCADDTSGCAGDAVSARGARHAATRTAHMFWPIALVGLVNRRWRRARASAPDRDGPRPSP